MSDTDARREDVEALGRHRTWGGHTLTCQCGADLSDGPTDRVDDNWRHHLADVVLAALPAPPVVDEAEIAETIRHAAWDASYPWQIKDRDLLVDAIAKEAAARLRGVDHG